MGIFRKTKAERYLIKILIKEAHEGAS